MAAKRERARHAGAFVFSGILAIISVLVAGCWYSTQYIASMLAYQPELGRPLFTLLGFPIYPPFSYFQWVINFNAYAPDLFTKAMWPMIYATFIAVFAAFFVAWWRSRMVDEATTHGSARWASKMDIMNSGLIHKSEEELTDGVMLGVMPDNRYLSHNGPEHISVIAPTRSGKGVGLVIPTLLTWRHSVVVNDIKGELWRETAGYRSTFSNVIAFDPAREATARFNPLFEVRMGRQEVKDVQNITNLIVDPDDDGKNDYWKNEADAFLVGAILHILYAEPEKTLAGVYNFITHPDRTLEETLRLMLQTKHLPPDKEGEPRKTHLVVARAARAMLNKAPNERAGVLSSAKTRLSLYVDPIVADATSTSDFRIDDLQNADYPISLYIIYPPSDMKRLRALYRLVLNQITQKLTEESSSDNKHKLLFLLDEFPSLGKLNFFEEALGYAAGYKIKAMLISQNYNQLRQEYGNNNSIEDSCHIRVYFAPNSEHAAEDISKALGSETVIVQNRNYGGNRLSPWLGHVMVSNQETSRRLLTANEVFKLPKDKEIVIVSGTNPIEANKIVYYSDNNLIPKTSKFYPAPKLHKLKPDEKYPYRPAGRQNPWLELPPVEKPVHPAIADSSTDNTDSAEEPMTEDNKADNNTSSAADKKEGSSKGQSLSPGSGNTEKEKENNLNVIRTDVLEREIDHNKTM